MRSYKQLLKKIKVVPPTINKEVKGIDRVFPLMSDKEKEILVCYSMRGSYNKSNNTMTMGGDAFERIEDYEKEMIAKYDK